MGKSKEEFLTCHPSWTLKVWVEDGDGRGHGAVTVRPHIKTRSVWCGEWGLCQEAVREKLWHDRVPKFYLRVLQAHRVRFSIHTSQHGSRISTLNSSQFYLSARQQNSLGIAICMPDEGRWGDQTQCLLREGEREPDPSLLFILLLSAIQWDGFLSPSSLPLRSSVDKHWLPYGRV